MDRLLKRPRNVCWVEAAKFAPRVDRIAVLNGLIYLKMVAHSLDFDVHTAARGKIQTISSLAAEGVRH
jgi:hypothetical protein